MAAKFRGHWIVNGVQYPARDEPAADLEQLIASFRELKSVQTALSIELVFGESKSLSLDATLIATLRPQMESSVPEKNKTPYSALQTTMVTDALQAKRKITYLNPIGRSKKPKTSYSTLARWLVQVSKIDAETQSRLATMIILGAAYGNFDRNVWFGFTYRSDKNKATSVLLEAVAFIGTAGGAAIYVIPAEKTEGGGGAAFPFNTAHWATRTFSRWLHSTTYDAGNPIATPIIFLKRDGDTRDVTVRSIPHYKTADGGVVAPLSVADIASDILGSYSKLNERYPAALLEIGRDGRQEVYETIERQASSAVAEFTGAVARLYTPRKLPLGPAFAVFAERAPSAKILAELTNSAMALDMFPDKERSNLERVVRNIVAGDERTVIPNNSANSIKDLIEAIASFYGVQAYAILKRLSENDGGAQQQEIFREILALFATTHPAPAPDEVELGAWYASNVLPMSQPAIAAIPRAQRPDRESPDRTADCVAFDESMARIESAVVPVIVELIDNLFEKLTTEPTTDALHFVLRPRLPITSTAGVGDAKFERLENEVAENARLILPKTYESARYEGTLALRNPIVNVEDTTALDAYEKYFATLRATYKLQRPEWFITWPAASIESQKILKTKAATIKTDNFGQSKEMLAEKYATANYAFLSNELPNLLVEKLETDVSEIDYKFMYAAYADPEVRTFLFALRNGLDGLASTIFERLTQRSDPAFYVAALVGTSNVPMAVHVQDTIGHLILLGIVHRESCGGNRMIESSMVDILEDPKYNFAKSYFERLEVGHWCTSLAIATSDLKLVQMIVGDDEDDYRRRIANSLPPIIYENYSFRDTSSANVEASADSVGSDALEHAFRMVVILSKSRVINFAYVRLADAERIAVTRRLANSRAILNLIYRIVNEDVDDDDTDYVEILENTYGVTISLKASDFYAPPDAPKRRAAYLARSEDPGGIGHILTLTKAAVDVDKIRDFIAKQHITPLHENMLVLQTDLSADLTPDAVLARYRSLRKRIDAMAVKNLDMSAPDLIELGAPVAYTDLWNVGLRYRVSAISAEAIAIYLDGAYAAIAGKDTEDPPLTFEQFFMKTIQQGAPPVDLMRREDNEGLADAAEHMAVRAQRTRPFEALVAAQDAGGVATMKLAAWERDIIQNDHLRRLRAAVAAGRSLAEDRASSLIESIVSLLAVPMAAVLPHLKWIHLIGSLPRNIAETKVLTVKEYESALGAASIKIFATDRTAPIDDLRDRAMIVQRSAGMPWIEYNESVLINNALQSNKPGFWELFFLASRYTLTAGDFTILDGLMADWARIVGDCLIEDPWPDRLDDDDGYDDRVGRVLSQGNINLSYGIYRDLDDRQKAPSTVALDAIASLLVGEGEELEEEMMMMSRDEDQMYADAESDSDYSGEDSSSSSSSSDDGVGVYFGSEDPKENFVQAAMETILKTMRPLTYDQLNPIVRSPSPIFDNGREYTSAGAMQYYLGRAPEAFRRPELARNLYDLRKSYGFLEFAAEATMSVISRHGTSLRSVYHSDANNSINDSRFELPTVSIDTVLDKSRQRTEDETVPVQTVSTFLQKLRATQAYMNNTITMDSIVKFRSQIDPEYKGRPALVSALESVILSKITFVQQEGYESVEADLFFLENQTSELIPALFIDKKVEDLSERIRKHYHDQNIQEAVAYVNSIGTATRDLLVECFRDADYPQVANEMTAFDRIRAGNAFVNKFNGVTNRYISILFKFIASLGYHSTIARANPEILQGDGDNEDGTLDEHVAVAHDTIVFLLKRYREIFMPLMANPDSFF